MNRPNTFGSFIRDARTSQGKTLKDVAEHMGWSIIYLSDIERERRNPPKPDAIKKLGAFLGVPEKELYNKIDMQRQRVELEIKPGNEKATDAALLLARKWTDFTDDEFSELIKLLTQNKKG